VNPSALTAPEARVLGCLVEKKVTTPDAYPLSLNALRLACNQSTNRDPVVEYDEALIREALHRLERRSLVRLASGAGSRASKYRHLLAEALPIDPAELAVMCVLMLRGPQTPGELKQRAERMHPFAGLGEVCEALDRLTARGLAVRLARRPGQKEERYAELLSERGEGASAPAAAEPAAAADNGATLPPGAAAGAAPASPDGVAPEMGVADLQERVERLEREVAELRAAIRHPVGEGAR
jgi:uncharacterized protein